MKFEVVWAEFAEKQLDKIFLFYHDSAGREVAVKLVSEILLEPDRLKINPFVGQLEPLLKEKPISYRYLVYKSFKIIYSVDENEKQIKIADVFDTRQKPEKIEQGFK